MELVMHPSKNSLSLRAVVNIVFGILVLIFPGLTLTILAVAFAINLLIVGLFMVFEPAFDTKNKHGILTVMVGLFFATAGVYVMSRPLAGIVVLSLLIAAWALLIGLTDLFVGFKLAENKASQGWLFTITGMLSIIFAVYLAFNPLEGSLALVWLLGVYSIVVGVLLGLQMMMTKPKTKRRK